MFVNSAENCNANLAIDKLVCEATPGGGGKGGAENRNRDDAW